MKRLMAGSIIALVASGVAPAQMRDPLSAREVLDRTLAVHANCRSYADEGKSVTEYGGGHQTSRSFSTAFLRPASFRFELWLNVGSQKRGFIAWKNGASEKLWSTVGELTIEQPLAKSLRDYERFSGGSSLTMPTLLLPGLLHGGSLLDSLTSSQATVRVDNIDGRPAFRIESKFDGQAIKLWIDQQEFLVIKIQHQEKGNVRIETNTTYKPRVNVDIPDDKLAFNPPAASIPSPNSGASNIEIVSFSWSREIQRVYANSAEPVSVSANPGEPSPPAPDPPSPFPPGGKLPVAYIYSLKIKNVGKQEIRGVLWDYIVTDPASKRELGRKHFWGRSRLKPDRSETMKARLPSPPSRVISAEGGPNGQSLTTDQADIRCVLYADGSWWKHPTASAGECENFVGSSVWRKR